jgi:phosphoribosylformimino-5-aminoimidazole carboxamide ribotide isomerase
MRIIPAIDIIAGKTVRLKQGRYDRQLDYDMTPVEAAREWEAMGAELIHVVDLEGAKKGAPVNLEMVKEIVRTVNVPIEVGGGFRKEVDIKNALNHGVTRVVIGSKAFEDIDFARTCLENFHDKVILSVDAKDYKPRVWGWKKALNADLFELLAKFRSFGAKEIIYTDISKDGMLAGPSTDQIERILDGVGIKVIAAGGVKDIGHIKELKRLEKKGLTGVIIGRALYEGTINLREAIDAGKADHTMP